MKFYVLLQNEITTKTIPKMEVLDILLIIVAISAIIRGFSSGLISRVGAVAAIVVAVLASRLFGPAVYDRWGGGSGHETLSLVVCYGLVFVLCYLGVRLAAGLVRGAVHTVKLGALDRLGGAAFSLLEWMIAASLVMNLYAAIVPSSQETFTGPGHGLRQLVFDLAPAVIGYLSELARLA